MTGAGRSVGARRVYTAGGWQEIAVWRRGDIGSATRIAGPCIVEEDYTTIYLTAGWVMTRGRDGHLIAVKGGAA